MYLQTITIQGIHCEACIKLITKKISKLPGVQDMATQGLTGIFTVKSENQLTLDQLNQALAGSDYTISSIR